MVSDLHATSCNNNDSQRITNHRCARSTFSFNQPTLLHIPLSTSYIYPSFLFSISFERVDLALKIVGRSNAIFFESTLCSTHIYQLFYLFIPMD